MLCWNDDYLSLSCTAALFPPEHTMVNIQGKVIGWSEVDGANKARAPDRSAETPVPAPLVTCSSYGSVWMCL